MQIGENCADKSVTKFKNNFLKSNNIPPDAFWQEEHDGIKIINVALLDKKLLAKNCSAP